MAKIMNVAMKLLGILYLLVAVAISTGHYEPSRPLLVGVFAIFGVFLTIVEAKPRDDI